LRKKTLNEDKLNPEIVKPNGSIKFI